MRKFKSFITLTLVTLLTVSTLNISFASEGIFNLDDALTNTSIVDGTTVKTYNVALLPDSYLDTMSNLGSESGNYGDGSTPAPPVSYDYTIKNINLRNSEDNATDRLENGGILQSVTLESNGATDNLILAVAKYNGYTLTNLTSYSVDFSDNTTDVVITGYMLSDITANTSIKLFLWDALWGMQPQADPISIFTENSMDMSVNFLYNNSYVEKELNYGQSITAEINIKSTMWWNKDIAIYCAAYDLNGKMLSVSANNASIKSDGIYQFVSTKLSLPQNAESGYHIKAFAWGNNSLQPYIDCETIQATDNDYHSNTLANARFVNYSKPITGSIDTTSDVDYIKFIPSATQEYLIQATSEISLVGTLYNDQYDSIATANTILGQDEGFLIQKNLLKGQTYYIGVSGNSAGSYSLSITPHDRQIDTVISTGRSIVLKGDLNTTIGESQSVNIEVIGSTGVVVEAQGSTTDESGLLDDEILVNLSNGEYYIVLSQNGIAKEIWTLAAMFNTHTFAASEGEYCTIPISVTDATSFENIAFAVGYSSNELALFDACDYTTVAELGIGEITEGFVNILDVKPSYILFSSTRPLTSTWSGVVNTVKLKSKQNANVTARTCVYQVI